MFKLCITSLLAFVLLGAVSTFATCECMPPVSQGGGSTYNRVPFGGGGTTTGENSRLITRKLKRMIGVGVLGMEPLGFNMNIGKLTKYAYVCECNS